MEHGWVALLRAVNLGVRNKVPMAELRALLADAGYGDVRTYIASGNVLFTSDDGDAAKVARRVERTIEKAFGVATTAVVRTLDEVRARCADFTARRIEAALANVGAAPDAPGEGGTPYTESGHPH